MHGDILRFRGGKLDASRGDLDIRRVEALLAAAEYGRKPRQSGPPCGFQAVRRRDGIVLADLECAQIEIVSGQRDLQPASRRLVEVQAPCERRAVQPAGNAFEGGHLRRKRERSLDAEGAQGQAASRDGGGDNPAGKPAEALALNRHARGDRGLFGRGRLGERAGNLDGGIARQGCQRLVEEPAVRGALAMQLDALDKLAPELNLVRREIEVERVIGVKPQKIMCRGAKGAPAAVLVRKRCAIVH